MAVELARVSQEPRQAQPPFLLPSHTPTPAPDILQDFPVARREAERGSIFNTLETSEGFTYVDRVKIASQLRPSWDERRETEFRAIIKAFHAAGDNDHADRIENCGQDFVTFRCAACGMSFGQPRHCRDRFCPYCAERRAARIIKKKLPLMRRYHNYVFLTLTFLPLEHITYADLHFAFASWKKLWDRKFMREACYGALRTFEVTYGKFGFHPHLHILIALRHRYLSIEAVRAAWFTYTRANWCHIKPASTSLPYALLELVKYPLKPVDFYDNPQALFEYAAVVEGARLVAGCGCFDRIAEAFKPHARLSEVPCPCCGQKDCLEKIGTREPITNFLATDWGWEFLPGGSPPTERGSNDR